MPKYYVLAQFPYPSGALHMGHVRVYAISDAIARHRKLSGFDVLHPMGWDAFGLPAENAAIERGVRAADWTSANIAQMRRQLNLLSLDINWDREVTTCRADYYRWTQWIFVELWRRGLVYQSEASVNWDPVDKTVLADEQIDGQGRSWRSGALVERKLLKQWFLKITAFAKELQSALDGLEWPKSVKEMQRNWIGYKVDSDGNESLHLRDWLISRQRAWGTPIPIIHCPACGPVADEALPVQNESDSICKCPKCNREDARRETDTMDTFMDSSWYFMRFIDAQNKDQLGIPELLAKWLPVDVYVGGVEHAIMHLLYARFITRALVKTVFSGTGIPEEPFKHLICQGLVEGKTFRCPDTGRYLKPAELEYKATNSNPVIKENGKAPVDSWEKMSKSKYNGVDPTDMVQKHGADALRLYILFKAPPEIPLPWSGKEIAGPVRWLNRLLKLVETIMVKDNDDLPESAALSAARDDALKKIDRAFQVDQHNLNTAVAALMQFSNAVEAAADKTSMAQLRSALSDLAIMLFPMAPNTASELYHRLHNGALLHVEASWPKRESSKKNIWLRKN